MSYENSAGLGVNNQYGPRKVGGGQGPYLVDGYRNEYVVDLTAKGLSSKFPVGNGIKVFQTDLTYATLVTAAAVSATTSTTGGTGLAASTAYYYKVAAILPGGQESVASNEVTVTTGVGATNSNTVTWSATPGAVSYKVYRGTAAGAETVFYAVGNVLSYVDTGAPATDGTPITAGVVTIGGTSVIAASESSPVDMPQGNTGVVVINGYTGKIIINYKNISGDATH